MALESSELSQQDQSLLACCDENLDKIKFDDCEVYEAQLLGFSTKYLVNGIYNAVNMYFEELLEALERCMAKKFSDIMNRNEISDRLAAIKQQIVSHLEKVFDALELYLVTNLFCIPHSVVLPEDQIQVDAPVKQEDSDQMKSNIECMQKKILAVRLANAIINQRIRSIMELQECFDSITERLDGMHRTARQQGVIDLRGSMSLCSKRILSAIHTLCSIHHQSTSVNGCHQSP